MHMHIYTYIYFNICSYISRASFVVQSLKNLPAMQEPWLLFLGPEDPLEKEMASHSENPMDRGAWLSM